MSNFELPLSSFAAVYEDVFIFIREKHGCVIALSSWNCVSCSEECYGYFFHR